MYTDIKLEIDGLEDYVKSMDDGELVAEIHELCYDNDIVSDILHDYWFTGELDKKDREDLEWLYVIAWIEDGYNE